MSGKICFGEPEHLICIYLDVLPFKDPPDFGKINLRDLLQPIDEQIEVMPVDWLQDIGLDLQQQRGLAAMVQISNVTAMLPERLGGQIMTMMNDQIADLKLPQGFSLHLEDAPGKAASAA